MLIAMTCTAALAHTDDHSKKVGPAKKAQKAWGIAGDAKAAKRSIEIRMTDNMRFTPALIDVKQGETARIVIKNQGRMLHEFVLGTKKELDAQSALMVKFPTMEHAEPCMAHVGAGKTGEIV